MIQAPLISVIIPTYNRASVVCNAVEAVLQQTYAKIELIVVDDGSTDDTVSRLQAYSTHLKTISTTHAGPSSARNCGIKIARGDYIAFLDSDDLWLPGKLEKQLRYMQSLPNGLVCQTEETWIRNGRRVNPRKKHKKQSGWIYKACLPLCIVSPSAVMIHKSVFEKVGLFDETLLACEDYDLWLRIAPHYPIYLLDEPLITKHGGHADQQSRTVPALDRLRIKAICKSLENGNLIPELYAAALEELQTKCRIYATGCTKRGKQEESKQYLKLAEKHQRKKTRRMANCIHHPEF
ncbi:MAG: glycosyltransferase [Deltaproteobacteria bacterium]|nr:glycosyltransferase [Deltaproteobacteria bacterium]